MDMDPLLVSLINIQKRLNEHDIPNALIGGFTLTVWGRARATKDLDLKIMLRRDEANRLLTALGNDYQLIQRNPLESLRRNGVIFVQDAAGTRIDLLLAEAGFDQQALPRARDVEILPNIWIHVISAEDLIIYKMISTRLLDQADVETVMRAQGNTLDDAYVISTLRAFEEALADSTLIVTYQKLRKKYR